jgi:hypothetical protein
VTSYPPLPRSGKYASPAPRAPALAVEGAPLEADEPGDEPDDAGFLESLHPATRTTATAAARRRLM